MIGQIIAEGLEHLYEAVSLPKKNVSWDKPTTLIEQFDTIIKQSKIEIVDVIWCAGKTRFDAEEAEVEKEFIFFNAVVNGLRSYNIDLRFSLLSSAGGTYENTQFVNDINAISPVRPYAFGKLRQEELLLTAGITARIYRLSSVYGYKYRNPRLGLINTMIANALSGDPVKIFGRQDNFRDYISHFDIARYIIKKLSDASSNTHVLASGRATSIQALVQQVQNLTNKRVKTLYIDAVDNANDIIFEQCVIPPDFQITSLEEGILNLYARMRFS